MIKRGSTPRCLLLLAYLFTKRVVCITPVPLCLGKARQHTSIDQVWVEKRHVGTATREEPARQTHCPTCLSSPRGSGAPSASRRAAPVLHLRIKRRRAGRALGGVVAWPRPPRPDELPAAGLSPRAQGGGSAQRSGREQRVGVSTSELTGLCSVRARLPSSHATRSLPNHPPLPTLPASQRCLRARPCAPCGAGLGPPRS